MNLKTQTGNGKQQQKLLREPRRQPRTRTGINLGSSRWTRTRIQLLKEGEHEKVPF